MEITAKVIEILPEMTGTSEKTGKNWRNQEIVLQTEAYYPQLIAFVFRNQNVDKLSNIHIGDKARVIFEPESRKYNDKYYTTLNAWDITIIEPTPTPA